MNSEYITSLIEKDFRMDNRKLEEYRKVEIETNVTKNAEGSARCKIGDTEIIVGVKMDVGAPYPDSPDEGTIIVTAELSPLASPEFELGPPGPQATELARIIDRGIRESKFIDFKKLCIEEGKKVWVVFIDLYPINDDGNLIDAAALAALAALKSAKYPQLLQDGENYRVNSSEHTAKKLDLKEAPVTVTVSTIGGKMIVDPTAAEEQVVEARLSIAVAQGKIHAMQKGDAKGLKIEQVDKMLELAMKKEQELRKYLPK
jgi:exosome complex component RRP42